MKCCFHQSIESVKAGEEPPLPAPAEPPPDVANQVGWRCAFVHQRGFWGVRFFSLVIVTILHFGYHMYIYIYTHIFFYKCIVFYYIVVFYCIIIYIYIMYTTQHPRGFPVHIVSTCHGHSSRRRPWRSLVPPGVPRPPKSWESPARASAINGSPQELWWATSAWGWWNNDIYPLVMSK